MSYIITTPRLALRNWEKTDLSKMAAINQSPAVMRYFPNTQDQKQTAAFIKKMQQQFLKKRYCYFATELLETKEFIGFIGLSYQDFEADFTPCVDIGWRLKETAWGKGYATEGAKACLEYAFNTLQLEKIYAVAPAVNTPSIAVMEKIGMKQSAIFSHPKLVDFPHLQECVVYSKNSTSIVNSLSTKAWLY